MTPYVIINSSALTFSVLFFHISSPRVLKNLAWLATDLEDKDAVWADNDDDLDLGIVCGLGGYWPV